MDSEKPVNRVGWIQILYTMITKVMKVKDAKNKLQGCCDALGGCRCND